MVLSNSKITRYRVPIQRKRRIKIKSVLPWLLGGMIATPAVSIAATVTTTLSFGGEICGGFACADNAKIDQTYGDIPGKLDVIWDVSINTPGLQRFSYYKNGFANTTDVAYGVGGTAEVFLYPETGYRVTLNSFDLTGFTAGVNRTIAPTLLDGDVAFYNPAPFLSPMLVTFDTDDFGIHPSNDGIKIRFLPGSLGNVGIDNINFTVGPVPLPAAAWLFGSAILGLVAIARRRA